VFCLGIGSAHERQQLRRNFYFGFISKPHARAVLTGHPASRKNRLRLREQEWLALAGGLLGRQPLQGLGLGAGCIPDADTFCLRRDSDYERLTKGGVYRT